MIRGSGRAYSNRLEDGRHVHKSPPALATSGTASVTKLSFLTPQPQSPAGLRLGAGNQSQCCRHAEETPQGVRPPLPRAAVRTEGG